MHSSITGRGRWGHNVPRVPRYSQLVAEPETDQQPRKRKRRFSSDRFEQAMLIGSILLIGAAIKLTLSLAGKRIKPGTSSEVLAQVRH